MMNDPITKVMQDASEIVRYDEVGIPLYIREGLLSSYPDHRALCHWHEDIEWVQIRSGQMNYYINGKRVLLNAGERLSSIPARCTTDILKTARNVTLSVSCAIRKSSPRTASVPVLYYAGAFESGSGISSSEAGKSGRY